MIVVFTFGILERSITDSFENEVIFRKLEQRGTHVKENNKKLQKSALDGKFKSL